MNGQRSSPVFVFLSAYICLCAVLFVSRAHFFIKAQTSTPEPSPQATATPTPLDGVRTIELEGNLYEGLGESACYEGVSYGGRDNSAELELSITVVPDPDSITCAVGRNAERYTQSDSTINTIYYPDYTCEISYENIVTEADITFEPPDIVGDPPQPYQKIVVPETNDLSAACPVTDSTRELSLNLTEASEDAVYNGDSVTVTKHLIFTNTIPWIKLKNASYSGLGSRYNSIPWNVTRFGNTDDQLANNGRIFSTGVNSGVATTFTSPDSPDPTPFQTGSGFFVQKRIDRNGVIAKHWSDDDYSVSQYHARSLFFDYVRSRKQVTQIDLVEEMATTIDDNGIYRIGTEASPIDLTLEDTDQAMDSAVFNDKHTLLYITGKLTIDIPEFSPTNGHTIFIAPEIEIGPTTQNIRAVLMSHVMSVTSTDQLQERGLGVRGNIVATQYFVNNRAVADNSFPSIFLSYDPTPYVELLPFLSTSQYEWTYDE
jgi:hypothetical protein